MKNAVMKSRLMKRAPWIALIIVAIALAVAMQKPTLFNKGKSDYSIALCKNASTLTFFFRKMNVSISVAMWLPSTSASVIMIILS